MHAPGQGVDARRIANQPPRFQRPELSRPELILTLPDARMLVSPRRGGKGAWPATDAAAGGDRAGAGVRGLLTRSGDSFRWGARPPSASSEDKARDLPIGPRPRRPGPVGNDRTRVRLSLNRAAHRTLADNASRGATGFVETVHTINHSGRRPALRDPFHFNSADFRVRLQSHATKPPQSLRDSSPRGGASGRR